MPVERAHHPYLIAGYFYHPKETPQQYPRAPASSPATSDLLPVCGVACCGCFIRVESRGALLLYMQQSFIPLYGRVTAHPSPTDGRWRRSHFLTVTNGAALNVCV